MKGYKVFEPDWTCRGFEYEVGKTYEHEGEIGLCEAGFHFCRRVVDCFNYYPFDPNNKVAEVEAIGKIINGSDKSVTDKIIIVREIPWQELLALVNIGKNDAGLANTGNYNTGNWNTGNWNTGNFNTGDCNTGDCNIGDRNTGDCNTGDWNIGDFNTGDFNTGNFNSCNFSNGIFCTEEPQIPIFDKPSNLTLRQWRSTHAHKILSALQTTEWIKTNDMTKEEKMAHPEYEVLGGYLREYSYHEAWKNLWSKLDEEEKKVIMEIPNFDKEKFKKITGIDVDE